MEAHNVVRSVYKKSKGYNLISSNFIISILLRALRQVSLINILYLIEIIKSFRK